MVVGLTLGWHARGYRLFEYVIAIPALPTEELLSRGRDVSSFERSFLVLLVLCLCSVDQ